MKVRIVSTRDIHELLSYPACIEVVRAAMMEVSRRNVHMPLRHGMRLPNSNLQAIRRRSHSFRNLENRRLDLLL